MDFEQAIEASHRALDQITRGDPSGFFELRGVGECPRSILGLS